MFEVRQIPNMLTWSRVIFAIALVFIHPPLGIASIVIYLIALFTELIDGPIARKLNAQSDFGANLDTIADALIIAVIIFVFVPAMDVWTWIWPATIVAIIARLGLGIVVGLIKHGEPCVNHTYASKMASLFIYILPIAYFITSGHAFINYYIVFLLVLVFISVVDEFYINMKLKKPNLDIPGFWKVKEENAKVS